MIRDIRRCAKDLMPDAPTDVVVVAEQLYLEVRKTFALNGMSPITDEELSRTLLFAVADVGADQVRGAMHTYLGRTLTLERFHR